MVLIISQNRVSVSMALKNHPISTRWHKTAEASFIINLLAWKLSKIVHTDATFRPGAGPHLIADRIHGGWPRKDGAFIFFGIFYVDCVLCFSHISLIRCHETYREGDIASIRRLSNLQVLYPLIFYFWFACNIW